MVQTSLDRYFTVSPKARRTGPTFLDLPRHVRQKIYLFAGVTYGEPLSLNVAPHAVAEERCGQQDSAYVSRRAPERARCDCFPPAKLCLQLLFVSRTISEEVSFLLYSKNRFRISYSPHGGLSALRCLRPTTFTILRSLRITLNESSENERCNCHNATVPLLPRANMQSRNHQIFMNEWKRTCAWLSSHIPESHLRLALICDTNSYDFAHEIIQPLGLLPTLKDFAIRLFPMFNLQLDGKLDTKLYPLVTATALKMTKNHHTTPTFEYTELPCELQDLILEFTDLVAPFDLSWAPKLGLRFDYYRRDLNHCSTCYSVREAHCWPPLKRGIFAAHCSLCWRFPHSLFLVNRSMNESATRIFYSYNHFKILPYGGRFEIETDKYTSLSPFISSIPEKALYHLRSVQFVMPYTTSYISTSKDSYLQWDKMVERLKQHNNVSQLRITFDMSEDRCLRDEYRDDPVTQEEDLTYRKHYKRLVSPFAALNPKPKDFFIHLAWPMYGPDAPERRDRWQKNLETMVKGENYDSSICGKYAVDGRWQATSSEPDHIEDMLCEYLGR